MVQQAILRNDTATSGCVVAEIDTLDSFLPLEEEWNALLARSHYDSPFLRHEWLANWWRHFGGGDRLAVTVVRRDGALIFGIPLMETRGAFFGLPFTVLRSLTNHHSFRHHFLMAPDAEQGLETFWRHLRTRRRSWNLLQLTDVPGDAGAHERLLRTAPESCIRELTPMARSPYVPIETEWEGFYGALKSKFRSNMRNRAKRLGREGPVAVESHTDVDAILERLPTAFDIERKSWKGEAGTAIAMDATLTGFYSEWARIAARRGWMRLSFLTLDGRPIAFDYSVEYGGRMHCMKIGYDPEFRAFSGGQLLTSAMLEHAFGRGFTEYDFLGQTSVQKRDWTRHERSVIWVWVYGPGLVSRAHHVYKFRVRAALARLLKGRKR